MDKKTPLYDIHLEHQGKIVPFGGYLLPVQYPTGVIAEHMAVRTKAGLFDVSHMGEIWCEGTEALENLNRIMTNDFTDMTDGQARYTAMCNEKGGTVDDLIVYRYGENKYFIVVNAANKDKDYAWMKAHQQGAAEFRDISPEVAQIAIQGPLARKILLKVARPEDVTERYYHAIFDVEIQGIPCCISCTGYTGEDGYEIYCASKDAEQMWRLLMEAGKEDGLIPCGLGARDTLRLEAAMPLYGHEMDDTVTPLETGLGFAVKMKKEDFIGKAALEAAGKPSIRRVGLKVTGRGIIREHQEVFLDGKQIGHTTSGTHCPYLGYPIAMALVEADSVQIGTAVQVNVRGRMVDAEVTALPFYNRKVR